MRTNLLLELLAPVAAQLTTDLAECLNSGWALALSDFGHGLEPVFQYGSHPDARLCAQLTGELLRSSADPGSPILVKPQRTERWAPVVLCPILVHGETASVLAFGCKVTSEPYSISDLDLVRHFGAHLAYLISDERLAARYGRKLARQQRTDLELESARLVQERFLPATLPRIKGLDFCGECLPCHTVGGDFFDFIAAEDSSLLVTVGDVSGKGVPAAIVMAGVQASMRVLGPARVHDLRGLIRSLNHTIWQVAPEQFYATMFCARIDATRHELSYVNAGHDRAILLRHGCRSAVTLATTGTVLGLSTRSEFRESVAPFGPGDILVVVTDGVTDIADTQDRPFAEILLEIGRECADRPSSDLAAQIMESTEAFDSADTPADDRTVVVVRFQQAASHATIDSRAEEPVVMAAA